MGSRNTSLSFAFVAPSNPLRELPSVDELAGSRELEALVERHGRPLVVAAVRAALERAREDVKAGFPAGDLVARTADELEARLRPRLRRVLNATGVVVHTNLGRAPLPEAALERVHEIAAGYSNLEYDVEAGSRGSRQDHVAALLRELTGAEAALVVNNNAAAVLLALAALAEGREVIVSRGELIEIGDGFRIPDVLARSGAILIEVGTTNRTRLADYEQAVGDRTAALLRVHQSNFRLVGFTEQPRARDLARLADRRGLALVEDLGSGALVEAGDEPTVAASVEAGAHVVTFSGDKLLGGPQAGIAVGRADLIERDAPPPPPARASARQAHAWRPWRARWRCTAPAPLDGSPSSACSRSRSKRYVPAPSGSPSSPAGPWRRRRRVPAAARSRSRRSRAMRARSRSSWPSRFAAASRP